MARAYYYCPRCRSGHCPWDAALRLAGGDLTPAAEELVSLAGLLASFAEAAGKVLPRLAGLRLAESTAERPAPPTWWPDVARLLIAHSRPPAVKEIPPGGAAWGRRLESRWEIG